LRESAIRTTGKAGRAARLSGLDRLFAPRTPASRSAKADAAQKVGSEKLRAVAGDEALSSVAGAGRNSTAMMWAITGPGPYEIYFTFAQTIDWVSQAMLFAYQTTS
jgi:hypothetical protein